MFFFIHFLGNHVIEHQKREGVRQYGIGRARQRQSGQTEHFIEIVPQRMFGIRRDKNKIWFDDIFFAEIAEKFLI